MAADTHEGTMEWEEGRTWYRVVGDLDAEHPTLRPAPIVILHGGPGYTHDYLDNLAALADVGAGRPIVFYDQIGCGNSEHLPDAPADFWSVDLFKRELNELIAHLKIADRYHLLGQSWGGMLAMEFALERPAGLLSIVIANSPASIPLWIEETSRLRFDLPADVQTTLLDNEAAGTTDSDAYEQAVAVFNARHVCRLDPVPEPLARAEANVRADPTVYHTMNGPSEFHVIGHLRDWDITDQLGRIDVPALVISGEYDEATPAVVRPVADGIPNATWELVADASHCTHLEQPERFMALVDGFIRRQD